MPIPLFTDGTVLDSPKTAHAVRVVQTATGFVVLEWWRNPDAHHSGRVFGYQVHFVDDAERFLSDAGWRIAWQPTGANEFREVLQHLTPREVEALLDALGSAKAFDETRLRIREIEEKALRRPNRDRDLDDAE